MKSFSAFPFGSLACAAFLAGCHGGGGGDSTPAPVPPPTTFTVAGTLAGLTGGSVVLQNNGGSNLTVSANGSFTFATAINSGAAYAVTVLTQPSGPAQTCTVTSGSGTALANVTSVAVNCTNNPVLPGTVTIGGTLTGLATGASVVLQNNGGSDLTLSANGNFTFGTAITSGGNFAVSVLTQPSSPAQTCTVTSGSGTASANVTNVAINCQTGVFGISGAVTGLIGSVVLQNNGAANQTISASGAFSFAPQSSGTAYAVTVLSHPTGVTQTCSVTNGAGNVAGAAVTNIAVTCVSADQTAPTVTARTPTPNVVGTMIQGNIITATFSEAVNPLTVNTSSFTVTTSTGTVSGELTLSNGDKQVTFTAGSVAVPVLLAYDTTYTVTITTAVTDPSANPIAANVVWSFNTGKKLALGFTHTCARFTDGRVKCWGNNDYGQLGGGFDPPNTSPRGDQTGEMEALVPVALGLAAPPINAVALAAGDDHTCAIISNGNTICWGRNDHGELGQGTTENNVGDEPNEMASVVPVDFGGGHKAIEIAAGQEFTCARLDDNTVKCWGFNNVGQLGQGNTTTLGRAAGEVASAPAISLGTGLTAYGLALGHYHVCALLRDAAGASHVKCWGDNRWGQLGRGNTVNVGDNAGEMGDALTDVNLGTGRTAVSLAANGGHTCAVLDDASVKCWGLNTWGQVGRLNGNDIPADRSVCVPGNDCVGDQANELGDVLNAAIPGGVARLSAAFRHNCALLNNGQTKCWGSNEQAQMGLEDITGNKVRIGDQPGEIANLVATQLQPGAVVQELTAGGFHTCVWTTDAKFYCWGDNSQGQLGLNSTDNKGDAPGEMGAAMLETQPGT